MAAEGHGRSEKGHPDHLGGQEAGDCRRKNTEGDDESSKLTCVARRNPQKVAGHNGHL